MELAVAPVYGIYRNHRVFSERNPNLECHSSAGSPWKSSTFPSSVHDSKSRIRVPPSECSGKESCSQDEEVDNIGVRAAISTLKFYKREISPLLPKSFRYIPTCSEYSMIAYRKYGFVKGTMLTAWRICRCNPLGGSGFDPPRWFNESPPPEQ